MDKSYVNINRLFFRIAWKYKKLLAKHLYCKTVSLKINKPIISFSFDDAPRTAFINGGKILKTYGAEATFYVSFGLLGSDSPSGAIGLQADLRCALDNGHEIGCHTYDHKNSWKTETDLFVQSVLKNSQALSTLFPETTFLSLAYPICAPRPQTKKIIGKLFRCCRGGGQTFNVGKTDLNLLKAFFLDLRTGVKVKEIKQLIDKNIEAGGWLIFATHDINDNPSLYGCSKKFFDEVVKYAAHSNALILPVGKACERVLS